MTIGIGFATLAPEGYCCYRKSWIKVNEILCNIQTISAKKITYNKVLGVNLVQPNALGAESMLHRDNAGVQDACGAVRERCRA